MFSDFISHLKSHVAGLAPEIHTVGGCVHLSTSWLKSKVDVVVPV